MYQVFCRLWNYPCEPSFIFVIIHLMRYFSHIRYLYLKHISHKDKEGLFLVLVFFTLTFIVARLIVYSIKYHWLSPQYVGYIFFKDVHIHHLVFGILLLLIAGIIRIPRLDDNWVRFSSILYGIGAALTLDEFSLWLRLNPDAYFGSEGRISIDAVVLFTLIVSLTLGYGNFLRKILDHTIFYFFIKHKRTSKTVKGSSSKKKKLFFLMLISLLSFSSVMIVLLSLIPTAVSSRVRKPLKKITKQIKAVPVAMCSPANLTPHVSIPVSLAMAQIEAATIPSNDFCLYVPVFYLHHVQPQGQAILRKQTTLSVDNGIFAQQMEYLVSRGYHTIPSGQLIKALHDHVSLPPKSVVLTFDDGYQDIYDYVFPLLKKYNLTASLAIPTGLMGVHADTNYYLSWQELKEMVDSGHVVADDHTWSHADVGHATVDKDQFEILTAKQQLEQYLGKSITTFVYPYGTYKPFVISLLIKDGFLGAFTTRPGMMQCASQIYSLPRTRIANGPLSSYGL